jgi:hypothetical protein
MTAEAPQGAEQNPAYRPRNQDFPHVEREKFLTQRRREAEAQRSRNLSSRKREKTGAPKSKTI